MENGNGRSDSFVSFPAWGKRSDPWIDRLWLCGFAIAALILLLLNLGTQPLKDWDEGLVAQVAREIWQAPAGTSTWLYPTLWGEPYFNKPPLIHWMIAGFYQIAGVHEWTARLPGALLTWLSVLLFYGVSRSVFYRRSPAVFATLVYLTSLPVIRYGRFAMLDGAILCFALLLLWCLLRSRQDYRWLLGAGFAFGLLCLTKGVLVAVLLGGMALLFLAWDTPRLLRQPYLWLGLGLGSLPAIGWYVAQWLHYGTGFLGNNLVEQSLQRIWTEVEDNGAPPWYYLLEVLKYGAPWILFLPLGLRLAWRSRNLSWARLAIGWGGVYLLAISLMATKLPWYVLPLFPAIALIVGAQLAEMWHHGNSLELRPLEPVPYSRVWPILFGILALVGWLGCGYWIIVHPIPDPLLSLISAVVGSTFTAAAFLVARQNPQILAILAWGTYLALALLMISPHWVWELAETYPVQPVAAIVAAEVPIGQSVYTSYPYNRPSLNFYSQRQVRPQTEKQLRRTWRQTEQPYLLLDSATVTQLNLRAAKVLAEAEGWLLVTKDKI